MGTNKQHSRNVRVWAEGNHRVAMARALGQRTVPVCFMFVEKAAPHHVTSRVSRVDLGAVKRVVSAHEAQSLWAGAARHQGEEDFGHAVAEYGPVYRKVGTGRATMISMHERPCQGTSGFGALSEATSTVQCDRWGAWITHDGTFHYVASFEHVQYANENFPPPRGMRHPRVDIATYFAYLRDGYLRVETDLGRKHMSVDVGAAPTDAQVEALAKMYRRCDFTELLVEVWSVDDAPVTLNYGIGTRWADVRADIVKALGGSS